MGRMARAVFNNKQSDLLQDLGQLSEVEELPERPDVGLRHLERLELAELPVVAEGGDVLAQPLEGVVQPVHPLPLARVRRPPPLVSAAKQG